MYFHIILMLKKALFYKSMSISDNLKIIKETLPPSVSLVAVSKYHPYTAIQEAYNVGHRVFGESRMQELREKCKLLPHDIDWHFIGHLQRNKVKDILPYVHTIQSVDSERLLTEINKESKRIQKPIRCFLEIHIAEEESKEGFTFDECEKFISEGTWKLYPFAYIGGIMGMATFTDDVNKIKNEFKNLKKFFNKLKNNYFSEDNRFSEISMGMSNDYQIAIEEGSSLIRIGRAIFGEREY